MGLGLKAWVYDRWYGNKKRNLTMHKKRKLKRLQIAHEFCFLIKKHRGEGGWGESFQHWKWDSQEHEQVIFIWCTFIHSVIIFFGPFRSEKDKYEHFKNLNQNSHQYWKCTYSIIHSWCSQPCRISPWLRRNRKAVAVCWWLRFGKHAVYSVCMKIQFKST